jgi:hypothetical protein
LYLDGTCHLFLQDYFSKPQAILVKSKAFLNCQGTTGLHNPEAQMTLIRIPLLYKFVGSDELLHQDRPSIPQPAPNKALYDEARSIFQAHCANNPSGLSECYESFKKVL